MIRERDQKGTLKEITLNMTKLPPLQRRPAPKIGLVLNSIDVFDPVSKDRSEKAIRAYYESLLKSGQIDAQSIITKRIFGPHEAWRWRTSWLRRAWIWWSLPTSPFPTARSI